MTNRAMIALAIFFLLASLVLLLDLPPDPYSPPLVQPYRDGGADW